MSFEVQLFEVQSVNPQECVRKRAGCGTDNFFLIDNPIFPNFQRKQGNKVIQKRKEKANRDEGTIHSGA